MRMFFFSYSNNGTEYKFANRFDKKLILGCNTFENFSKEQFRKICE